MESGIPSIFTYECPRAFLGDTFHILQKREGGTSLRTWCKRKGFKSHSLFTLLLNGKRPISLKHAPFLSKAIGLSPSESLYFQALIQFSAPQSAEERDLGRRLLFELKPRDGAKTKQLEEFKIISDWIHSAILAMTELHGFTLEPAKIQYLLNEAVSVREIRSAVDRLIKLGLLKKMKSGKWIAAHENTSSVNDDPNSGARIYHRQVAEIALRALETQSVDEREFQGFSLSVASDRISEMKAAIRDFRERFCEAFGQRGGDKLCQLNIQFFGLSRPALRGRKGSGET